VLCTTTTRRSIPDRPSPIMLLTPCKQPYIHIKSRVFYIYIFIRRIQQHNLARLFFRLFPFYTGHFFSEQALKKKHAAGIFNLANPPAKKLAKLWCANLFHIFLFLELYSRSKLILFSLVLLSYYTYRLLSSQT